MIFLMNIVINTVSHQSSSKALEQEVRERATVLQTEFENSVHSDAQSLQAAKKGACIM